jgi:hypothetical protein
VELVEIFRQAGILALLSLMVAVVPMVMGIVYAVRPTEARLALMRPLSLAGLFAGLCGLSTGVMNMLRGVAMRGATNVPYEATAAGLAEALVTLVVAFGCLTVGWLCVALGMHRQS